MDGRLGQSRTYAVLYDGISIDLQYFHLCRHRANFWRFLVRVRLLTWNWCGSISICWSTRLMLYITNFPPLAFWLLIPRIEIQLPKCLSFRGRSWRGRFRAPAIAESSFHSLKDYSGFVGRQRLFLNVETSIIEFVRFLKLLQVCVWNVGRVLYKLRYYSLRRALIFWGFEACGARSRSTGFHGWFVLGNKKSNLL